MQTKLKAFDIKCTKNFYHLFNNKENGGFVR